MPSSGNRPSFYFWLVIGVIAKYYKDSHHFLPVAGIVFIRLGEEEKETILSTPPAPKIPLKIEKPTRWVKMQVPVDFEFNPYYYLWEEVNGADWYEYVCL